MQPKKPKNDKKTYWTRHVREKMDYYNLGEGRIRRVLKSPNRTEEGIAENTVAVMQKTQTKKPSEIWAMYQLKAGRRIIISAWRYPGASPKGRQIFIPDDTMEEIGKLLTKIKKSG